MAQLNPKDDGITHINIYSKGETSLGQMLSNFYNNISDIKTKDGKFKSVEGYWYWLSIECDLKDKEILRTVYGFNAKKVGKQLVDKFGKRFDDDFENKIIRAIWDKVKQHTLLFDEKYRDLPFEHYYNYGGKIYDVKDKYLWMIGAIEKMAKYIYKEKLNKI